MSQQVIKIVAKQLFLGSVEVRNVWYYGCDATGVQPDDVAGCVAAIKNFYNYALPDLQTSNITTYGYDTYTWDGTTHWLPHAGVSDTSAGSAIAEFSSFQTAALMTFVTGVMKCRGRKFFAGITEDQTLLGSIGVSMLATMVSWVPTLLAPVFVLTTLNTWYPGTMRKAWAFAPWLSGSVSALLSTWRKRKPGYGI
jgi:hypothetical protein